MCASYAFYDLPRAACINLHCCVKDIPDAFSGSLDSSGIRAISGFGVIHCFFLLFTAPHSHISVRYKCFLMNYIAGEQVINLLLLLLAI